MAGWRKRSSVGWEIDPVEITSSDIVYHSRCLKFTRTCCDWDSPHSPLPNSPFPRPTSPDSPFPISPICVCASVCRIGVLCHGNPSSHARCLNAWTDSNSVSHLLLHQSVLGVVKELGVDLYSNANSIITHTWIGKSDLNKSICCLLQIVVIQTLL